ncbi:MAG: peptidase [Spirochaetes bacterium GWD1_27_9]|nr:MAG: peptidase [Spirochaetes bacterium GWC1_27_15]OHD33014.1 MAG: peptidase [Spirochaetes bacterium GWD1_27_9]
MFSLHLRLYFLMGIFFGIIYFVIFIVGNIAGFGNNIFYLLMAGGMVLLQYLIGPKMVEWTMRIRYVTQNEEPALYEMVSELAQKANIPMPKVGISENHLPNAFAFGRSLKDGRVCVTSGIVGLLNKNELKAVLAHEVSHLKNRDVLFVTLLSVVPLVLYYLASSLMWGGSRRYNRESSGGNLAIIGIIMFLLYFVTNLLVLYASRIREYFADRGAVELGSKPEYLASALYKLVYGCAKIDKDELRETEGLKAFFANDPSKAEKEFKELRQLDADRNGRIDTDELDTLKDKNVKISFGDKIMETLSTHPNMLKRIKALSELKV